MKKAMQMLLLLCVATSVWALDEIDILGLWESPYISFDGTVEHTYIEFGAAGITLTWFEESEEWFCEHKEAITWRIEDEYMIVIYDMPEVQFDAVYKLEGDYLIQLESRHYEDGVISEVKVQERPLVLLRYDRFGLRDDPR